MAPDGQQLATGANASVSALGRIAVLVMIVNGAGVVVAAEIFTGSAARTISLRKFPRSVHNLRAACAKLSLRYNRSSHSAPSEFPRRTT
jgi:hypothetical protein